MKNEYTLDMPFQIPMPLSAEPLNDQLLSGRVFQDEGQVLVLVDQRGIEQRIRQTDIKKSELLHVSSMPTNITELMTEGEFYDLIGYLLNQRLN